MLHGLACLSGATQNHINQGAQVIWGALLTAGGIDFQNLEYGWNTKTGKEKSLIRTFWLKEIKFTLRKHAHLLML